MNINEFNTNLHLKNSIIKIIKIMLMIRVSLQLHRNLLKWLTEEFCAKSEPMVKGKLEMCR